MFSFWFKKNCITYLLYPLGFIYGVVSAINIYLRSRDSYRAKPFVISVGNINVGGTGKTPLTIALANDLIAKGCKVAVVGHGYKSTMQASEVVNKGFSVDQIGDEASQMLDLLHKDTLLVVGKSRLDSVKLAEEKNVDIIILDDGYTATYIQRDFNVVVIDGKVQLGNQLVMPAGPLREPLRGLNRADCLVVLNRHRNLDFKYEDKTFYLKTKISYAKSLETKSLYAFCGLGIPTKFYNSLNKEGLCLQETKSFADHYKYTDKDLNLLIGEAKSKKLQLVTTSKDLVKIDEKYHNSIELVGLELELTKSFNAYLASKISNFVNKK